MNTLEGKVNSSSVWCKMKNVETSPALNYSWNDSEANKILLSTLCVDSRNIVSSFTYVTYYLFVGIVKVIFFEVENKLLTIFSFENHNLKIRCKFITL